MEAPDSPVIEDAGLAATTVPIGVIGLGHVGLPTALGLAELGWVVAGTDQDQSKMDQILKGQSTFYEPGIQELLAKHLPTGRFVPLRSIEQVVRRSSVVFICVGTPQTENGTPDLSQVEGATRAIAQNLNGYKLVVEKSTVPVMTIDWVRTILLKYRNDEHTFDVASNPEFLQEGTAIHNVLCPDRIVIGVDSARARELLLRIYKPMKCPKIVTDGRSAEMIKHAANAFLATKISFINMIADVCESTGANVNDVARALGLDPRIGPSFLGAGVGFGGYCLPKDLKALMHISDQLGVNFNLLREVEAINQCRVGRLLGKIKEALSTLDGKTVAILGLSFKPETDDVREAPSLNIAAALLASGAGLRLYDPKAMDNFQKAFPKNREKITYCASPYEAAAGAHAIALVTEWEEFRELDLRRLRSLMQMPVFVDGRNLYDPVVMRAAGFTYTSIGRP